MRSPNRGLSVNFFFLSNFFTELIYSVKFPETFNIEKLVRDFMTFLKFYDA